MGASIARKRTRLGCRVLRHKLVPFLALWPVFHARRWSFDTRSVLVHFLPNMCLCVASEVTLLEIPPCQTSMCGVAYSCSYVLLLVCMLACVMLCVTSQPVVQWSVQRFRSERLRVRSRRSATFTPSAHVRRQSLPVWPRPPTLMKIPLPFFLTFTTVPSHLKLHMFSEHTKLRDMHPKIVHVCLWHHPEWFLTVQKCTAYGSSKLWHPKFSWHVQSLCDYS